MSAMGIIEILAAGFTATLPAWMEACQDILSRFEKGKTVPLEDIAKAFGLSTAQVEVIKKSPLIKLLWICSIYAAMIYYMGYLKL